MDTTRLLTCAAQVEKLNSLSPQASHGQRRHSHASPSPISWGSEHMAKAIVFWQLWSWQERWIEEARPSPLETSPLEASFSQA